MFSGLRFKLANRYMSDEAKIEILKAIMVGNVKLSSIKYLTFHGNGGNTPDNNYFAITNFLGYLKERVEVKEENNVSGCNLILIRKEIRIIDGKCKATIIWEPIKERDE